MSLFLSIQFSWEVIPSFYDSGRQSALFALIVEIDLSVFLVDQVVYEGSDDIDLEGSQDSIEESNLTCSGLKGELDL